MLRTLIKLVPGTWRRELSPDTVSYGMPTLRQRGRLFGRLTRRTARFGASATEFAVVAPVFFLMIVGFIEFGRALMVQQVLVNASRVGAREAITTSATTANVQTAVQQYTAGVAGPGVTVNVTPNPATAVPGSMITVTTAVPFNNVSWMASPWFLGGKTLSSSSTMRKEGFN
jgi:Flp pilus assembly protein TadG